MNKLLLVVLFALIPIPSGFLFAQSETTMADILETVNGKVKNLEDYENMEVVNITIDLLVGTQSEKNIYRYLDNSFAYTAYVFGDRRIEKINLVVHKKIGGEWKLVDKLAAAEPTLLINPEGRDLYEFKIMVSDFKELNSAGHFCLLIYHSDPSKN